MSSRDLKSDFLCPECGGKAFGAQIFVSTEYDPDSPWSSVLQRLECEECASEIPAHIAERWGGISIAEAKRQWLDIYKSSDS